ncbi:MAG: prepilin-type N-terminal cleavage/methylation domain-containing protein [Desulfuromusa sp.]|nr:prepilin-type N-terminal cleavage/methylation domain-containing protein [Desulfuromusa sp.]
MMAYNPLKNRKGFTLVELMFAAVIMGLVVTAILSTFTGTQKVVNTQEEIVDTQQNLKVAMNFLTRDIQMAGFLIPATSTAVATTPNNLSAGQILTLRTATISQDVARLTTSTTVSNTSSTYFLFNLATTDMVNLFSPGDKVRLIRSPDHEQRIDALFEVGTAPTATTLNIKGFTADTIYTQADLLVKTEGGQPNQTDYDLNNNQLRRSIDGAGSFKVIANNISNVDLKYITDSGKVVAIRVSITGVAFDFKQKTNKNRQLVKLISLKND